MARSGASEDAQVHGAEHSASTPEPRIGEELDKEGSNWGGIEEQDQETAEESGANEEEHSHEAEDERVLPGGEGDAELPDGLVAGMDLEGFSAPAEKVVKPLTKEALAAYKAAQDRAGVIYISRIPPGMRPAKVRHLMSAYGQIGRVYLQQEDPKRAYLRRKYTSTKKPHFTEGWVEFKDKKVARRVAEMLNAQPIGGKKGSRWRDDVWTMKYLPKFKWNMLTEQVAHEAAIHSAKLRMELSQSRTEQQEYLRNVELARVLDKRAERKREKGQEPPQLKQVIQPDSKKRKKREEDIGEPEKRMRTEGMERVLGSIF